MKPIRPRAMCCFAAYGVAGLASVLIEIGRDGEVKKAKAEGRFAGTPTGKCVEGAVKEALFPPFPGPPMEIVYPFMLR